MKKRFRFLFLVMLMVGCIALAGCSQDKTANAPANQSTPTTTDKAKSDSGNELADLMKSAQEVRGMSYEMITTSTTQGQTQTMQTKMWSSKEKIRMETELAGVKSIIISNGSDIWMYDSTSNTAMKMTSMQNKEQLANKWAEDGLSNMKIVAKEKMDGFDCIVVEVMDADTETKMWLRKDIGMPVRSESIIAGSNMVIEYKNFKVGAQDDSLFEIPAGAQVVQMPAMPSVPGQ